VPIEVFLSTTATLLGILYAIPSILSIWPPKGLKWEHISTLGITFVVALVSSAVYLVVAAGALWLRGNLAARSMAVILVALGILSIYVLRRIARLVLQSALAHLVQEEIHRLLVE